MAEKQNGPVVEVHSQEVVSNKLAIIHVLAALIKNPLLFTDDEYRFSINDFPEQFHKILYAAIEHLARSGMENISSMDIDKFLVNYAAQYKVFTANNGLEYIENILKFYDPKKFDYYYKTLKKYSLINALQQNGIDTKNILDPDVIDPTKSSKMYADFDNMTCESILNDTELKITLLKDEYINSSDRVENKAGDGIFELLERLKETPDVGFPMISKYMNAILRGQRKGCLYLESAPSGTGKSRRGNGEAARVAVSDYYDIATQQWVHTGNHESVLTISTEMSLKDCQTMWLAFVAGVPEGRIKKSMTTEEEDERLKTAAKIISESNLYFVSISNFDTDDIINIIKKYHQQHGIGFVYFDYLSESIKLLSSTTKKTKVQGLRTDQVLLMMSSQLKDLAQKLNIFIWSATQLSGDYKNAKELDVNFLRSAKSLGDKIDAGWILMPVREGDKPIIDSNVQVGFEVTPNFVLHFYKVRGGEHNRIRLYVYFDRSTCQIQDCFVTDYEGKVVDIQPLDIVVNNDDTFTEKVVETPELSSNNLVNDNPKMREYDGVIIDDDLDF